MIDNEKDVFVFYVDNKEVERRTGLKEAHERFMDYVYGSDVKNLTVVREGKLCDRVEWVY